MNAAQGWSLITVGAVLLVMGSTMFWASFVHSGQRPARSQRPDAGLSRALACTSLGCGVITGVQWAVLSQTDPGAAWLAVLALPAFLAAATVTRLLMIARTTHARRQVRAIRRGRRCHR